MFNTNIYYFIYFIRVFVKVFLKRFIISATTVTLVTSPVVYGNSILIKCQYSGSSCCDGSVTAREWLIDDSVIMNNGDASDLSKYSEERQDESSAFILIVNHLDAADFGKEFKCRYNFTTSLGYTLTQDASTECKH